MLNIQRIQMLREVANRKTLAAVAEAYYMSPSAVSQQLATLERETGVQLLEREGRGVRLTTAALELVKNSDAIFESIERAEAALVAAGQGLVGSIGMSAFPTGARNLVIPALLALREAHPNLTIMVNDLEPEQALPMLGADELDLVVYYEWDLLPAIAQAGIKIFPLGSEQVYLTLPSHHPLASEQRPIALSELRDEYWIVGREATSMLQLVSTATSHAGFEPKTNFRTMDYQVILAAVGAGLGISIVPALALAGDMEGVTVRPLLDLTLHRTIKAAVRTGSEYNPLIKTVLDQLAIQGDRIAQKLDEVEERVSAYPDRHAKS